MSIAMESADVECDGVPPVSRTMESIGLLQCGQRRHWNMMEAVGVKCDGVSRTTAAQTMAALDMMESAGVGTMESVRLWRRGLPKWHAKTIK